MGTVSRLSWLRAYIGYQPVAELFVSLGLADRAIGRTIFETDPPLIPGQEAEMQGIPVLSTTSFPPPREELIASGPDFLLAYFKGDYTDGVPGLATLDQLDAAGVDVYTVDCGGGIGGEESTFDTTYGALRDLGAIFGVGERAEQVIKTMRDQIATVQEKVADQQPVKVLIYTGGEGPLQVVGGNHIDTRSIELAGAENVLADKTYTSVSLEAVAALDIEAFMIMPDLASFQGGQTPDISRQVQFLTTTFPNLPAVRDRRFVPHYLYTGLSPRQSLDLDGLARQLHPAAFE
ncbi:MAG: ABC transporter substrate-binding protein [Pseudonocardia sp.]